MDRGNSGIAKLRRSNSQTKNQADQAKGTIPGASLEEVCNLLSEISVQYIVKNGVSFVQAHPCVLRNICEKECPQAGMQNLSTDKSKKLKSTHPSLSRGQRSVSRGRICECCASAEKNSAHNASPTVTQSPTIVNWVPDSVISIATKLRKKLGLSPKFSEAIEDFIVSLNHSFQTAEKNYRKFVEDAARKQIQDIQIKYISGGFNKLTKSATDWINF